MTEEQIATNGSVTPPGEAIHLPGPSFLPVIVAASVTVMLVGVVLNWYVFGGALLVTVLAIARWAASTRADIADLPLEHH